jgi:hypothetical protein
MRRGILELGLVIAVIIGFHTTRLLHSGSVVGRISPVKATPSVIAVRGNDSVRVVSNNGHFGMELQPGNWKLIFTADEYNSAPFEKKVQVFEGRRVNLGEIRLTQ